MCRTCKAVNEGRHPGPKPDHAPKDRVKRPNRAQRQAELIPIEQAEIPDVDPADPSSFTIKHPPGVGRVYPEWSGEREDKQIVLAAQVLQLHIVGYSLRDIAGRLGITEKTASAYRQEALRRVLMPQAEEWRNTWLMRLEAAARVAMSDTANPDPDIHHKGIAALIRLAERMSRLLGLDAPAKLNVEAVTTELSEADRAFAEMLREEAAKEAAENTARGLKAPFEG
jgi:hypothetical protein